MFTGSGEDEFHTVQINVPQMTPVRQADDTLAMTSNLRKVCNFRSCTRPLNHLRYRHYVNVSQPITVYETYFCFLHISYYLQCHATIYYGQRWCNIYSSRSSCKDNQKDCFE
ncbi:hypothetical protein ScPMuIL_002672 [Solemya velum]